MKYNIIYETLVGSHVYGTNIPTSDIDIKGVYVQPESDILGFNYREQVNVDKDTTYYEIRRFLQLLQSANPTMLEMLFVDSKFTRKLEPAFSSVIQNRHKFLTKQCANSFGGYAVAQIKKAKGLNKKMNWEQQRIERKTVLDFCYVRWHDVTIPFTEYVKMTQTNIKQFGLTKLDHMTNCYNLYWSPDISEFSGFANENSNDVQVHALPKKSFEAITILYFNKDAYSVHCKEFNEYSNWLKNRNESRYVDTQVAGQQIDSKNIMHCVRLLDCAIEIAETGNLTVLRPNAPYLLKIRRGECNLNEIIDECEAKIARMDALYATSSLPTKVDPEFVNDLLLQVRYDYKNS